MSEPRDIEENPADRVKVAHLVTGLVFLGIAATWLLQAGGIIDSVALGVVLPLVLVAAGVIGLVAMVAGRARKPSDPLTTEQYPTQQFPTDDNEEVR